MPASRYRTAALRWGLIGLGVQAFVVVRLLLALLKSWTDLSLKTDARVLSSRMSQLKPLAFKWSAMNGYGIALALLLGLCLVVLLVLGLREAFDEDPPDEPTP